MNYIIKGHKFEEAVLAMIQMFYPNDVYCKTDEKDDNGLNIVNSFEDNICCTSVFKDGTMVSESKAVLEEDSIQELKRCIKLSIHNALKKVKDIKMPWGLLTGIRPAKRIYDMWEKGFSDEEIKSNLKEKYLISDEKIELMFDVARAERAIVEKNRADKIGLYIGIPFCPTRCLYCSFTSYPLSQYSKKVDDYLRALIKEFEYTSKYIDDKKYNIESIYIGGGTPTSLNEEQLDFLMSNIEKYFQKPIEFTVEAGRPDTITREKLRIIKKYGADRISINPQTMNDKTLKLIGRQHTVQDFIDAFYIAREEGHENINTDLILGLPDESADDVLHTFEEIKRLNPESVTVHTLAIKRASRLRETLENYEMTNMSVMEKMLGIAAEYSKQMDMKPYYMYRQKNMLGNFENVGYCKTGYECIYNVQIMEEKQTIIAVGAGASTKTVDPETNKIERVFNVKSVDDYISRIDEMIDRKIGGLK